MQPNEQQPQQTNPIPPQAAINHQSSRTIPLPPPNLPHVPNAGYTGFIGYANTPAGALIITCVIAVLAVIIAIPLVYMEHRKDSAPHTRQQSSAEN